MSQRSAKYTQIAQSLAQSIRAGELEPGQVLPPIRSLMDQHQVSLGTIQNAIGELEKKGLINRLASRGYFVAGDKPDASPSVRQIAFLTPALGAETDSSVEAMYRTLHNRPEVAVAAYSSGSNLDSYPDLVKRVLLAKPAGIVALRISHADLIEESGIPLVSLDAEERDLQCDRVFSEPYAAGQKVVEHLYTQGHREFALLLTEPVEERQRQRFRNGVLDTLAEYQISLEPEQLMHFATEHGFGANPNPYIDAQLAITDALERKVPFTALICDHDYPAIGAMQAASKAKLRIPDDIAVVSGYSCGWVQGGYPSLTTVIFRPMIMRTATRLLLERMDGEPGTPQVHYVHGELQVGQSSHTRAETIEQIVYRLANNQAMTY